MSNALAVAGVTAVLRDLLNDGLVDHDVAAMVGTNVEVSALPPDRVKQNGSESDQLNLFLYRVSPNLGWRNADLPSRDAAGERIANPALALDLHYLLSAYGAADLNAEILLGYAMQLMHENPVLTRGAVRKALAPQDQIDGTILPQALQTLRAADLAEQVEQIKITQETLDTEEMSKLWSSLQANYRPTAAYLATVVLIESQQPARSPLPVLTRGTYDPVTERDRGVVVQASLESPYPTLERLVPPHQQPAVRSGETLHVEGGRLDGDQVKARFSLPRLEVSHELSVTNATAFGFDVQIPANVDDWPAGIYGFRAAVTTGTVTRETEELPLVVAPVVDNVVKKSPSGGKVPLEVTCKPKVWRRQTTSLVVGSREIPGQPLTVAKSDTLVFEIESDDLPTGDQWIRLRVDGVGSLLVDRSDRHPRFFPSEKWTIPP